MRARRCCRRQPRRARAERHLRAGRRDRAARTAARARRRDHSTSCTTSGARCRRRGRRSNGSSGRPPSRRSTARSTRRSSPGQGDVSLRRRRARGCRGCSARLPAPPAGAGLRGLRPDASSSTRDLAAGSSPASTHRARPATGLTFAWTGEVMRSRAAGPRPAGASGRWRCGRVRHGPTDAEPRARHSLPTARTSMTVPSSSDFADHARAIPARPERRGVTISDARVEDVRCRARRSAGSSA